MRPGDAAALARNIVELARDAQRRQVMGENGVRAVQDKYSVARASRQYIELLSKFGVGADTPHPETEPAGVS